MYLKFIGNPWGDPIIVEKNNKTKLRALIKGYMTGQ